MPVVSGGLYWSCEESCGGVEAGQAGSARVTKVREKHRRLAAGDDDGDPAAVSVAQVALLALRIGSVLRNRLLHNVVASESRPRSDDWLREHLDAEECQWCRGDLPEGRLIRVLIAAQATPRVTPSRTTCDT